MVHDFGHGEVFLETLFARGAEEAVHLAAHLCGDAQRGAFLVGDVGRFDEMLTSREEVFLRAVFRHLFLDGSLQSGLILL